MKKTPRSYLRAHLFGGEDYYLLLYNTWYRSSTLNPRVRQPPKDDGKDGKHQETQRGEKMNEKTKAKHGNPNIIGSMLPPLLRSGAGNLATQ